MSDFCCNWTVFHPIFQNIAAWSVGNFKMGSGARRAKKVLIGMWDDKEAFDWLA